MSAVAPCLVCGLFTTYIAEHKGKIKSSQELDRPITLFPPETHSS